MREELTVIIQESSPDIIGITEVFPKNKLFDNQEIFYQINNYNLFTVNLQEGRGVILYVKSDLFAEQVYFEPDFQEAVWCRVKLKNRDTLLVGCIYRSPNSTEANFQHLKTLMSSCRDTHYTHKLLMGDFNFKEINWCEMTTSVNETHISSQFLECVRDTYFFQHILNPTRYREGNESSVLDLILTNEEEMVTDIKYLPGLGKSDHLVIDFSLFCYTVQEKKCSAEKRNFFKGDYDRIRDQLSRIDWHQELNEMNLPQSWSQFAEININLIQNYIPVSKRSRDGSKYSPFIKKPCLDAIKEKRKRWLKYKYCKSDTNYAKYKVARNTVTNKIRSARYQYEKNLASKIKTDNKIFWNYVRSKTKTKSIVTKLEMPDGNLTTTDQETADTLNNYFSTVFEVEPDEPLPEFENRTFTQPLEDISITNSIVDKVLSALNAGKSQGPDQIHPKFLKETKDLLIEPLTIIFQKSLNENTLPAIWKKLMSVLFLRKEKRKIQETTVPLVLLQYHAS